MPDTPPINPAPASDAARSNLEIEKLQAEVARAKVNRIKSELEILELRRPWFQRPAVLQPLAAIAIAVLTGAIGYANGWFQTKLESLRNAEDRAKISLDQLNEKRSALNAQIDKLTSQRDSLILRLDEVSTKAAGLQAQYDKASQQARRGEQYRRNVTDLQNQLRQLVRESSVLRASAAAWHDGDVVRIDVVDSATDKPISSYKIDFLFSVDDQNTIFSALLNDPKRRSLPLGGLVSSLS